MIFPKAISGCRDLISPSNNTPNQVIVDWEGLTSEVQDGMVSLGFLGLDWALRCVRVKAISQQGQGHTLCHKARAQSPTGLGPCPMRHHEPKVLGTMGPGPCLVHTHTYIYIYIHTLLLHTSKCNKHNEFL